MKTEIAVAMAMAYVANAQTQTLYGQCGGQGWSGAKQCASGSSCSTQNPYYAQCLPAATTMATSVVAPSSAPVSAPASPTSGSTAPSSSGSTTGGSTTGGSTSGKVSHAGVNIAGCDFGCNTDGYCTTPNSCPTSVGPTQMEHFTSADGLNMFRLPVGWQYLVNNNLGGTLDASYLAQYDGIMQSCLKTGAKCILDIHNYARWNGGIIGQGGPSNAQFTSLWQQLAKKYASQDNVVFGVMNEPHDLDMTTWAATVQEVVTTIRNAGATSQWILLPGTDYTSAGGFQTNSAPALSSVKNPDGTTNNLVYDIHMYYDSDSSGTNAECVTNHISDAFSPLATYLRQEKRQAFLSETGGGNVQSCVTDVCAALDYLNTNSDVYLGWTGWAAGGFATSYVLAETPNGNTDQLLVSSCIAGQFK